MMLNCYLLTFGNVDAITEKRVEYGLETAS